VCEQCGYLLRGLDGARPLSSGFGHPARPVCPECGTPFDVDKPWSPEAWPVWPRLALLLCGPLAASLAALLAACAARGVRNWVIWPLWSLWLIWLIGSGFVWPLATVKRLARKCVPRNSRRAAAWRLALPALMLNAALICVTALLFLLLL